MWRARYRDEVEVALKVARDGHEASCVADEAEALLLACGSAIPRLIDLGRVPEGHPFLPQGSPYIATSWVEGEPLEPQRLGSDAHRMRVALAVARQLADALWQLHEAGVAHGDVKPSNVVVCTEGTGLCVRLLDFGFSTALKGGRLRGATPRYLAPEAASGRLNPSGQDLWALGIVLAETASSEVAEAADPVAELRAVALPAPFDRWCAALTARDPGARPSAEWLAGSARAWAGDTSRSTEAWRVRASYLRVRRAELELLSTARDVRVDRAVGDWFTDVVAMVRKAAELRAGDRYDTSCRVVEPMDAAGRARWLVALVGASAAGWPIRGALLEVPERELYDALERLAAVRSPRAWTLRDVTQAVEGGRGDAEAQGGDPTELEIALELGRSPVRVRILEAAESRVLRGELDERLRVALADGLRGAGELGRALACVREAEEGMGAAVLAETLRRMGETVGAREAAQRVAQERSEAGERARAVLARLELDQGRVVEALAIASDPRSAQACEVSALAHLSRGEHDAAMRLVEQGLSLAGQEESRARLQCVRGMCLHATGDAEVAHEAFARAAEHAVRAGAVVEEATYRTGQAAAAVDAGMSSEAMDGSLRAALLWEHLARPAQRAYAMLARASAFSVVGALHDARACAEQARDLARAAGDTRAEAYAWMALADASAARSPESMEAAKAAWELLGSAESEDAARAGARYVAQGGELDPDGVARLDRLASSGGTAAQAEWWAERARGSRLGEVSGRPSEILSHLARVARQRGPVAGKGRAMHEARLLAESAGDGEAVRLFASEQARLASKVLAHVPAHLRESASEVEWIGAGQVRPEAGVSVGQARQLEGLVRGLARRDNLRGLLEQALDALVLWTGVERGLLLLRAPDNRLVVRAARNLARKDLREDQVMLSQSLAHRALETREPVVAVDASGEISEVHASVHALGLRSVLAVPLLARGEAVGVAYLDDRIRAGAFGPQELAWVRLIGMVAAAAIADARDQLMLRRAARRAERAKARLSEVLAQREAALEVASQELSRARGTSDTRYRYDALVGRSEPMRAMLQMLDRITPTSVPVLIVGESGSGKELVARALHHNGPRGSGPFVSENCSAIPETLLESTLFGHVRGAFTGADRNRIGLFEAADGGTLFLDEIGEMSIGMQSKLLRALQDGEVHPVGSTRARRVDVRVIAATHRDMGELVREGRFREDLLYRLDVITVRVPSLRERREDIELLAKHFVARYGAGRKVRISQEAMARLMRHDWPGNVRHLENEMRRALVLCDEVIRPEHLSAELGVKAKVSKAGGMVLRERVDELERQLVAEALAKTKRNQTQAAKLLGLSRFGLQKMIRRLGVEEES